MSDSGAPDGPAFRRLAAAQAALVAAITGTGPVPAGFDDARVHVARTSLLAKRADEVRGRWPALANSVGTASGQSFGAEFARWAASRPTRGALVDGWILARERQAGGLLDQAAELELALREVRFVFDGEHRPRRRRLPSVRRLSGGGRVVGWRGRTWVR